MAAPASPGLPYVYLVHAIGRAIHGRRGVWGYVHGGMGAVTQALAAAARDLGVAIRTEAPVAEVLVEHGAATGVLLENGETLRARVVLSNADPVRTFLTLTPQNALPEAFRERILEFPPDRVAALTGLPEARIVELGRRIATTRPTGIRCTMGMQRHAGGGNAIRLLYALPGVTGDWRYPGGGASYSTSERPKSLRDASEGAGSGSSGRSCRPRQRIDSTRAAPSRAPKCSARAHARSSASAPKVVTRRARRAT